MKFAQLVRLVPVVLSLAIPSFAQITGDLIINVTDPSGAIISGADISVKSAAQGSTRSLKSDAQGIARFSLLNIGDYEVRIEAPRLRRHQHPRRHQHRRRPRTQGRS